MVAGDAGTIVQSEPNSSLRGTDPRQWVRRTATCESVAPVRTAIAPIGGESHSGDVNVCQDCGQVLDWPPHPHDLRPMHELQGDSEVIPVAVVCPECDNVVRITYPSWSSTPE
jgi:hypothetical protein